MPPQPAPRALPATVPAPVMILPPDDIDTEYAPAISFWQQPWVQNVLPLVSSLALHAVIIMIGVVGVMAAKKVKEIVTVSQEQIIIPESTMAETTTPGGVENPGLGGDLNRTTAQQEFTENTTPEGLASKAGENALPEVAGGGSGDGSEGLISLGPGRGMGRGNGSGTGTGDGSGTGTGDGGGKLAPFGVPGGGGMPGPRGKMFGNGGNARSIAFVCDASGSMFQKMPTLKGELAKAIDGLKPVQSFSIVFFANEKFVGFDNGTLVAATSDNKAKARQWLEQVSAVGSTNPIPGLEVAFKGKPNLLYLLTDGDFPNNDAVKTKIKQLNPTKQTRVNTIAFVGGGEEGSKSFVQLLDEIANQNGGQFRKVDESSI